MQPKTVYSFVWLIDLWSSFMFMKRLMLLFVVSFEHLLAMDASLDHVDPVSTFNSIDVQNHFRGQAIIPLYRGVHFYESQFKSVQDKNYYSVNYMPGDGLYSAEIHRRADVQYLMNQRLLRSQIKSLDRTTLLNSVSFESVEDLIDKYPKNYSNFMEEIRKIKNTVIQNNPFLSFSQDPAHAGYYAYGCKNTHENPLEAEYTKLGMPINKRLGIIDVVMLTVGDLDIVKTYDINRNVALNARTKTEKEIIVNNYVPGVNFILQLSASAPDLSDEKDMTAFGISQTIKSNYLNGKTLYEDFFRKDIVKATTNTQYTCKKVAPRISSVIQKFAESVGSRIETFGSLRDQNQIQ